jgi:anti-anti-sigma factor
MLEVQSWRLGSIRVLRLVGELDAYTAPVVRVELDAALLNFDVPALIVDFMQLTFLASAGVNLMLDMRAEVLVREGHLMLILPLGGRPRHLFELTGLVDHFEFRESMEEGVAALREVS